jgi:hypothetical protein
VRQDETFRHSKSLQNFAKDALSSFHMAKKNFASDARKSLSLDVEDSSKNCERGKV